MAAEQKAISRIGLECKWCDGTNVAPPVLCSFKCQFKEGISKFHVEAIEGKSLNVKLRVVGPDTIVNPADGSSHPSPFAGKILDCIVELSGGEVGKAAYPAGPPTSITWCTGAGGKVAVLHPVIPASGAMCIASIEKQWGSSFFCIEKQESGKVTRRSLGGMLYVSQRGSPLPALLRPDVAVGFS